MTEQQIQGKILKGLKKRGCYVFKVIAANRAGVPDIIGCSPSGRFFGIEVKRPGKNPSAIQLRHKEEILAANGFWCRADKLEDISCL